SYAGRLGVGDLRARRAGQDHLLRHARTERPRDGAPRETGGGNLVMLALYGHKFSSYTWKALIPLYANGTDFEFREVGPDFPENAEFVAEAHPGGKFPVLADRGGTIIEATAIVEHLALHHPGTAPLIPSDRREAAVTRMLDRVFDNYVMAS